MREELPEGELPARPIGGNEDDTEKGPRGGGDDTGIRVPVLGSVDESVGGVIAWGGDRVIKTPLHYFPAVPMRMPLDFATKIKITPTQGLQDYNATGHS